MSRHWGRSRDVAADGRRTSRSAVAAFVLLALAPGIGSAHASLVRSAPARRAVIVKAPDRVQLWFNERLEGQFSRVEVSDVARRTRVDLNDIQVDPADPKKLSVGLPPLPPGGYVVRFRVLSVDGHVVEAEFPFTVRAP